MDLRVKRSGGYIPLFPKISIILRCLNSVPRIKTIYDLQTTDWLTTIMLVTWPITRQKKATPDRSFAFSVVTFRAHKRQINVTPYIFLPRGCFHGGLCQQTGRFTAASPSAAPCTTKPAIYSIVHNHRCHRRHRTNPNYMGLNTSKERAGESLQTR